MSLIPAGWEAVIGLEVHCQLSTQSKIFSGSAIAYGAEPNTQASPIDLGMPGMLPVLNVDAVKKAVTFGLSVSAKIADRCVFARKHYFYPDLPKGYQISQYELPIVFEGHLDIELEDGTAKRIGITRAHLEEDAGKSVHEGFQKSSGIDLNRAGTPLIEIVSSPGPTYCVASRAPMRGEVAWRHDVRRCSSSWARVEMPKAKSPRASSIRNRPRRRRSRGCGWRPVQRRACGRPRLRSRQRSALEHRERG